jgi:hypothetical protein
MQLLRRWKLIALKVIRQFGWEDLRWSYFTILGMILTAMFVNLLMPHGWTVWPLVPVFGMLTVINELADRHGQGIPPFQIYAFVVLVIAVWFIGVLIMSQVNVFIQLLGVGGLIGFVAHGYIKHREKMRLMFKRQSEGRCVHCGYDYDENLPFCENCGEEPDPDAASAKRTSEIVQHGKKNDHARKILTHETLGNIASRKEKALLDNSPRRRGKPPKR